MRPEYDGGPIDGPWFKPWLIQRLDVPYDFPEGHFLKGKDNPFAFGGGFRNGGFSGEAMDAFRPIFRFSYMGSAEFEFGAVPKGIQSILRTLGEMTTSWFEISMKDVMFQSWDVRYYQEPDLKAKATVYVIAKRDHHKDAEKYIRSLTKVPAPELKGDSRFRTALLEPKDKTQTWLSETKGWFDIDNCLMFFIDKTMFEKVWALLAEKPTEKVN